MVIKIKIQRQTQKRFNRTTLSALILAVLMAPTLPVVAQDATHTQAGLSELALRNQNDLDDDDDGIPDSVEGLFDIEPDTNGDAPNSTDSDGDRAPNGWDKDTDNDGILDIREAHPDAGLIARLDRDNDGDIDADYERGSNGIADILETSPDSGVLNFTIQDTDGDGTPDFMDIDSDNDGITDLVEAGGVDADNDGRIDNFVDADRKGNDDNLQVNALPVFDTDFDGTPDYRDTDSDNDSLPDSAEAGANPNQPVDTDGDGAADYRETDSDGDGVGDADEAGGNNGGNNNAGLSELALRNQNDLDDDDDGIPDSVEGLFDIEPDANGDAPNSTDSDGDRAPNGWDKDSDNDGILDILEAHPDAALIARLDRDNDGDIDADYERGSNGIADILETSPDSGVLNFTIQDTDGDGTPDFLDIDSDNDGITDLVEAGGVDSDNNGRIDNFVDSDRKGNDDNLQVNALPVFDTDGDGTPDYRDTDSDNDSVSDRAEAGANPNQPVDTDGDGAADYREVDSNGDGVSDGEQAGVVADGNNGDNDAGLSDHAIRNRNDLDDDDDGIPDSVEGLVDILPDANGDAPNSTDSDGDRAPNGWDRDSDNDGILDVMEAHPDAAFIRSIDRNNDGNIDADFEVGSNGIADILETSPDSGVLNFTIQDTDGDGTPDFLDLDSDNDGITDLVEAGGVDADNDGRIDNFVDSDRKGNDDNLQVNALPVFDTDGDGIPDYRETDSDADAIPDMVEAGPVPNQPADTDGDGAPDFREQDSDNDTVPDSQEMGANPAQPVDSNNDGTPDFQDSGVSTGAPKAPPVSNDVDGDGIVNSIDLDDDNDGLLDAVEGDGDDDNDTTINQYDLDSDNDGVTDIAEASQLLDLVRDLDLDNDGRLDSPVGENGFADILESTPDSGTSTFIVADSDGDGVPDFKDLDSDNDSIYDALESGRLDTDRNGRLVLASNESGLVNGASNALLDTDADGVVDNRDLDSDNDGLVDLLEARGTDSNGDGRIDEFDDLNGDGADDGLQRSTVLVIDTDSDRTPDYRDLDSDQDSLSDLLETQGAAADRDNDGVIDDFIDGNSDGLDDNVAANPVRERDTDRDGIPDQVDLDSDGDGFSDLVEAGGLDIDNDGTVDVLDDADTDGIPDIADASVTGGEDNDQDGIDDMFDVTFTGGNDADGDGIADQFDPDNDGNGFVGPSADDSGQGTPIQLPDADGNGTPDIQESEGRIGGVETGLGGSGFGCSVSPTPQGPAKGPDPMLLLMLFASMASLFWRTLRRVAMRPPRNPKGLRNAGLVAAAVSTFALSGCSMLGLGGSDGGGSDHNGRFYVGAGGLVSMLEPNADKDNTVSLDETQSFGGTFQLGYDISNRFSIEGHGSSLGEATLKPSGSIGYQVGGLSALMYALNDHEDRGRREGFNVFGRLGGGTMRNQGEGVRFKRINDYHLLAGLGLEYGFRSGIAVRGEFVAHETDAKYAQLGLVYRIGDAGRRTPAKRVSIPTPPAPQVATAPVVKEPVVSAPLDSDADGVEDARDACPTTGPGVPVNAAGCALFNGVIEGINFESGSDRLTSEAQQILDGVASTLNSYPEIRVAVEAHTDNQGSADSNLQLSKRRAIAVARYLVEQGVAGPRLQPQAYGESQPRETNQSAAGRAKNRRVEFQVVQ